MTLTQVKAENKIFFEKGNKRFFNDVAYKLYKSGNGQYYFVQVSNGFHNDPKNQIIRVRPVDTETLKLGSSLDKEFKHLGDAKDYIKRLF